MRFRTKSGEYIWTRSTGSIVARDENGKPIRMVGTVIDINARKLAEEELARHRDQLELMVVERTDELCKSEERLELAVEGAEMGMWDWDIETGFCHYSDIWLSVLGYTRDEIEPNEKSWEKLLHPDDKQRVLNVLKQNLKGEEPIFDCEHRLRTKTGEWKWILARGKVVERDKNGKPLRHAGICTDIDNRKQTEEELLKYRDHLEEMVIQRTEELATSNESLRIEIEEHKQAEEELIKSEQDYRRLFESASDAIIIFDPGNETVLDVNERACQIYGFDREEFIGLSLLDISANTDDGKTHIKNTIEKDFSHRFETKQYRKDGSLIYFEVNASIIQYKEKRAILSINRDVTKRKKSEVALRESEERLDLALEGVEAGLWDHNLQTGEVIRNDRWAEMLGYTPDEIKGGSEEWLELVHPDDVAEAKRLAKAHEAGEIPVFKVEHRMKTKDDTWKWILNWGKITERDKDGKSLRAVGVHLDISDQKQAEEAMRRSEKKFRTYIESSPTAIFIADDNMKYQFVNQAACELTGYSEAELLNMSIMDLASPDFLINAEKIFSWHLNKGTIKTEILIRHKEGKQVYALMEAHHIAENTNIAFCVDITERKLAEKALVEERAFDQSLVETARAIILVLDTDGKIVRFNQYLEEMSGYSLEEVRGKDWFDTFLPKEDHTRIRDVFKRAVQGILTRGTVNAILTRDGRLQQIEWNDTILKDSDGNITGVLAIGLDITDRLKMEETLAESETLNRTVIENAPLGISVRSVTGKLISANDAWKNIWGISDENMEEFLADEPEQLEFDNRDDYLGIWKSEVERVYKEGKFLHIPELSTKKYRTAKATWISQTFYAIKDENGNVERVVILTNDISKSKQAGEELEKAHLRLKDEVEELNRQYIAMEQLLKHMERDKSKSKDDIFDNLLQISNPFIAKIRQGDRYILMKDLESFEGDLNDLVGKDLDLFAEGVKLLSNREYEVCQLIKEGKTTSEIAGELNISVQTVERHRKSIRKKLRLTNLNINLSVFLRNKEF